MHDLVERGLKPTRREFESPELAAARRRIREVEEQVKIPSKAAAAVEEVVPPKARFRLVAELAAEGVSVGRACSMLGVSRSGFYDSCSRAPLARSIRHAWLADVIAAVHNASRGTYGAPRVHAELVHGQGIRVRHNTVGLLMRHASLNVRHAREAFCLTVHGHNGYFLLQRWPSSGRLADTRDLANGRP